MAARSDAAIYSAAVVASVPLGIAIFYGAPYLAAAAVAAGPAYFALQAGISGVETGVEYGLGRAIGGSEGVADFSWTETFGKNFVINSATGGIGSKGKWLARAGAWGLRQGIEIGGETAYDVYKGRDFRTSLMLNAAGSIGGEALFRGIGYGAKRGVGALAARSGACQSLMASVRRGRLGGELWGNDRLDLLEKYLAKRGVTLRRDANEILDAAGAHGLLSAKANGTAEMFLRSNPTRYEVQHELSHLLDLKRQGYAAYKKAGPAGRELNVYHRFKGRQFRGLTDEQVSDAYLQVLRTQM